MDTDAIIGITDFGRMVTFIDASYAVHANMRSHTGGANITTYYPIPNPNHKKGL